MSLLLLTAGLLIIGVMGTNFSNKIGIGGIAIGVGTLVIAVVVLSLTQVRTMVAGIPVVGGPLAQVSAFTGGILGMVPVVGGYFK